MNCLVAGSSTLRCAGLTAITARTPPTGPAISTSRRSGSSSASDPSNLCLSVPISIRPLKEACHATRVCPAPSAGLVAGWTCRVAAQATSDDTTRLDRSVKRAIVMGGSGRCDRRGGGRELGANQVGVLGSALESLLPGPDRVVGSSRGVVDIAEVVVYRGLFGHVGQRIFESLFGLTVILLLEEGPAEAVEVGAVFRIAHQRPADERDRFVETLPAVGEHVAQVVQRGGILWVPFNRFPEQRFGFAQPFCALLPRGGRKICVGDLLAGPTLRCVPFTGGGLQLFPKQHFGLGGPARHQQRLTPAKVEPRVL